MFALRLVALLWWSLVSRAVVEVGKRMSGLKKDWLETLKKQTVSVEDSQKRGSLSCAWLSLSVVLAGISASHRSHVADSIQRG